MWLCLLVSSGEANRAKLSPHKHHPTPMLLKHAVTHIYRSEAGMSGDSRLHIHTNAFTCMAASANLDRWCGVTVRTQLVVCVCKCGKRLASWRLGKQRCQGMTRAHYGRKWGGKTTRWREIHQWLRKPSSLASCCFVTTKTRDLFEVDECPRRAMWEDFVCVCGLAVYTSLSKS